MLGGMARTAMTKSSQIAAFQKVPPTFFSDCYRSSRHGLPARVGRHGPDSDATIIPNSSIPKGATHLLRDPSKKGATHLFLGSLSFFAARTSRLCWAAGPDSDATIIPKGATHLFLGSLSFFAAQTSRQCWAAWPRRRYQDHPE
jgi:hypothetical protein